MSTIPRSRDISTIEQCSADQFDVQYLRTVKGQGFSSGYFTYPDGPVRRFLLIVDRQPLMAAWDDGSEGGATLLSDFFDPFNHTPQQLTFCEADPLLINSMGVSWQQLPDAHTTPGVIDSAEMIKSLLRRNREFIVRLRRDAHTSFLTIGGNKIRTFYMDKERFTDGNAETRLVHELTANHAFLSIDVWENQNAARAEDWALVPPEFEEGMIRFYSSSAPHLLLLLNGKEVTRLPLKGKEQVTIGRDPTNEMVVDNLSISRKHAQAEYKHGELLLQDLGSKNGVYYQGSKIEGSVVLSDGDEVQIGKHTLRFVKRTMIRQRNIEADMLDKTIVMTAPRIPQKEQPRTAVITYNSKIYPVRQSPFSIGSDTSAALTLSEQGIKDTHAVLERDSGGAWWVIHRGGFLSSTRVNGEKVRTRRLRSGDLVQIGNSMLRFSLSDEIDS